MTPSNLLHQVKDVATMSAIELLEENGHGLLALALRSVRRAETVRPPDVPPPGSIWTHKKGTIYRVIEVTNLGTDKPDEFPVTITYEDVATGVRWSRPLWRWYGSFTEVPEERVPATTGPGTNSGHGWAWKRPDGMVAKCGGLTTCKVCQRDATEWGLV